MDEMSKEWTTEKLCRITHADFEWEKSEVEDYVENNDPHSDHLNLETLLRGLCRKYQVGLLTETGLAGSGRIQAGEWELDLGEGYIPLEAEEESDILVRELEGAEGEPSYVAISNINGGDWLVVECDNERSMEDTASDILYAIDRHFKG